MKSVKPWPAGTECPEQGYTEWRAALNQASFCNAAESSGEWRGAASRIAEAAAIAVEQDWPYWAQERMWRDVAPLVEWGSYMQSYINTLRRSAAQHQGEI